MRILPFRPPFSTIQISILGNHLEQPKLRASDDRRQLGTIVNALHAFHAFRACLSQMLLQSETRN